MNSQAIFSFGFLHRKWFRFVDGSPRVLIASFHRWCSVNWSAIKFVNKTNKIIYAQEPSLMILMRDAISMLKWEMELKWTMAVSCSHSDRVMLDLFCSGCCLLQIHLAIFRHFNTISFTFFVLTSSMWIASNDNRIYINSLSRLSKCRERKNASVSFKWQNILHMKTDYLITFLVFVVVFVFFFGWMKAFAAFHYSCISYDMDQKRKTVESTSHAVHDAKHLCIYLTWLFRTFNWFRFILAWRAIHFNARWLRSEFWHFDCAIKIAFWTCTRVNTCYDLSTVHRVSNTVVCICVCCCFDLFQRLFRDQMTV